MRVYSDTALVASFRIPILDRYATTAFFHYPLQLDSRFTTGSYRVAYTYDLSGTYCGDQDDFDIVAGGHADGTGVSMHFFKQPQQDFVLVQTDSGRVIRKRNPRLV